MKNILKISKDKDNQMVIDNMELTQLDTFNIMFLLGERLSEVSGVSYNDILESLMLVECDESELLEIENNNKNILEDINNG